MYIIEFLGMPRAGKTTQINMLEEFLRNKNYSVKIISDRDRASKIQTPPTEIIGFKLIYYAAVLEEYFLHKGTCDYLIIDRGFMDSMVWFDTERILRHISFKRARQMRKTFTEYQPLVNQVFCLMTKPKTAIKRHGNTTHEAIDNVGMNAEYLHALKKAYKKNLRRFPNCTVIPRNLTVEEINKMIVEKVPMV